MIAGIGIENFTVFGNLDIPLSPRINVIIGSNGTGRLLADIRCETDTPWRRQHTADCVVLSVDIWNKTFADWPVTRVSAAAAHGKSAA